MVRAKKEKEKVCEVFDVKKNGKEKTIRSCGIEEEKIPSVDQVKKENNIFKTIIIIMLGLVIMFFAVYFIISYFNSFKVNGAVFEIDKTDLQGQTIYKTYLPGTVNNGVFILGGTIGTKADYNFYLRNDPRTLESTVPFNGEIVFEKNAVINMTDDFKCNGDGIIAIANLQNLYNTIGTKMIKDDNASCDPSGRYIFLRIEKGNETKIDQFGPACYDITIKNCEILKGTERFMLENFIGIKKATQ